MKGGYDALVENFECIEGFVRRLMIYTKVDRPTPAMTEILIKIMAELISVLALATKQMNQGRLSGFLRTNKHPLLKRCRKIRKEAPWGEQNRTSPPAPRSTYGRGV